MQKIYISMALWSSSEWLKAVSHHNETTDRCLAVLSPFCVKPQETHAPSITSPFSTLPVTLTKLRLSSTFSQQQQLPPEVKTTAWRTASPCRDVPTQL